MQQNRDTELNFKLLYQYIFYIFLTRKHHNFRFFFFKIPSSKFGLIINNEGKLDYKYILIN